MSLPVSLTGTRLALTAQRSPTNCCSFIDSLSAKVHPTPPAVEKLSELFQDFYHLAETHISTHISTLSSRQQRQFSNGTAALPRRKGERPASTRATSEQQMLTQTELDQRRKIRKGLERKRVALEEAVERRACEGVYERIWRHRSTQDEEQDEKLRSKTAALGVVGIGLAELGVQIGTEPLEAGSGVTTEEDVRRWLGDARDELIKMNDERFPLGKLLHLKAAHKAIVDTLSRMHHSSSSADEILPTMIYTLITTPMKGINVISNLYFIQRFRADSKIDGEAAYCLTNLEAAITFLETVDLASLRADEAPAGSSKSDSRPSTPSLEEAGLFPQASLLSSSVHSSSPPTSAPVTAISLASASGALPNPSTLSRPSTPSSHLRQRGLSHLLHQPSHALNTASDAVLHGADHSLKTITTTLEASYNLLFGRLKERQLSGGGLDNDGHIVVPTTLDEARQLVSTPGPGNSFEDDGGGSGASSIHHASEKSKKDLILAGSIGTGTLLSLIGGRSSTTARERSSDSAKSTTGSKGLAFTDGPAETESASRPTSAAHAPLAATASNPPTPPTVQATQSMRSLTNKFDLNPLNRLASLGGGGMAAMRNFGRSPSSQPSVPTTLAPTSAASAMTSTAPPSPGVSEIDTVNPPSAPPVYLISSLQRIPPPPIGPLKPQLTSCSLPGRPTCREQGHDESDYQRADCTAHRAIRCDGEPWRNADIRGAGAVA